MTTTEFVHIPRLRKWLWSAALAAALVVLASTAAGARPGELDPGFDVNGKVQITGQGLLTAQDMAVQNDGKIVVAGTASGSNPFPVFALTRLMPDGTLDSGFGVGGIRTTPEMPSAWADSVVILGDGSILVAGTENADFDGGHGALALYDQNGTLVPTFGNGGVMIYENGPRLLFSDIAVQPNGKIVLAGRYEETPDDIGKFGVMRVLPDGTPDPTFGTNGLVDFSFGPNLLCTARSLALDGNRIVVAGDARVAATGFQFNAAMAVLKSDGTFDNSFGGDGRSVTIIGNRNSFLTSVAVSGHSYIGGGITRAQDHGTQALAVKIGSDGSPAKGFGGNNGFALVALQGSFINSIAVQKDGKMVLGGERNVFDGTTGLFNTDFLLLRLTANGFLDDGFGQGGRVQTSFSENGQEIHTMAFVSPNKLLAAGGTNDQSSQTGDYDGFDVARYRMGKGATA